MCWGVDDMKSFVWDDIFNWMRFCDDGCACSNLAFDGSVEICDVNDGFWDKDIGLMRDLVFITSCVFMIQRCFDGVRIVCVV